MAISPENQYPGKITPSSPNYPYGSARNVTAPGDGTGTPLEQAWLNDLFGWWQAMLSESGITPDNNPETALASQYLSAVKKVTAPLGKNLIIDGGFLFWDEGTVQTSSGYGSDTMWVNENAGSTKTHTRQTFTLGQTDVPGNPRYYSRTVVSAGAAAGHFVKKDQRIEDVTVTAGRTVTLSFYARADANKNIAAEFVQDFGTGGSPSANVDSIGVTTFNLTTSWQKFSTTVSIPSIAGKTLGNAGNDYFRASFWFDAGSQYNGRTNSLGHQSGTFEIANVQLEFGGVDTDFEYRTEEEVRRDVNRYFFESLNDESGVGALGVGYRVDGDTFSIDHFLPTPMRGIPQLFFSSAGDFVLTELANNNTVTLQFN
jgi:hypothetical protein